MALSLYRLTGEVHADSFVVMGAALLPFFSRAKAELDAMVSSGIPVSEMRLALPHASLARRFNSSRRLVAAALDTLASEGLVAFSRELQLSFTWSECELIVGPLGLQWVSSSSVPMGWSDWFVPEELEDALIGERNVLAPAPGESLEGFLLRRRIQPFRKVDSQETVRQARLFGSLKRRLKRKHRPTPEGIFDDDDEWTLGDPLQDGRRAEGTDSLARQIESVDLSEAIVPDSHRECWAGAMRRLCVHPEYVGARYPAMELVRHVGDRLRRLCRGKRDVS